MPNADWSADDELPSTARLRPRIAGMGYRLAAAGPRTRQRMIEREAGFPPPDDIRYAAPLPAVLPQGETPWPVSMDEFAEGDFADDVPDHPRARNRGFPIWRSIALVTSAICGFSLVIFGQTLHLDRTLQLATKAVRPAPADNAAGETALDSRPLAPASPQTQPVALASATPQATLPPQLIPAAQPELVSPPAETGAPHEAVAQAEPHRSPPAAMASAARIEPPHHPLPRVYAALAPSVRRVFVPATPIPGPAEPRHVTARLVHYELPAWLTNPHPDPHPDQPSDVVMSPQPKTLNDQLAAKAPPAPPRQNTYAESAPSQPEPQPQRSPPPPHRPRSPQMIYAEAQYQQQRAYAPPPPPYYPPYYGYGGYYQQPAPYYYRPPQNAW